MPKEDYLPDPTKWIDTAPSTSSAHKKRAQRPLVQRRYGLMTPPATAARHNRGGENQSRDGKPVDSPGETPSRVSGSFNRTKAVAGTYGALPMTSTPPPARTPLAQLEKNRIAGSKLSRQTSIGGFLTPVSNPPAGKRSKLNPDLDDDLDADAIGSPSLRANKRADLGLKPALTGREIPSSLPRTSKLRAHVRRDSSPESDREGLQPAGCRSSSALASRGSVGQSSGSSPRDIRKTAMLAALNAGGPLYVPGDLLDSDDDVSEDGSATRLLSPAVRPAVASPKRDARPVQSPVKAASPPRPAATPEQPPASSVPPIGLTPVPAHVMRLHARLCGRDEERMAKIKSPWKKRSPIRPRTEERRRPLGPAKSMFNMSRNPFQTDNDDDAPVPGRSGNGQADDGDTGARRVVKRKRASSETDEYPLEVVTRAAKPSTSRNSSRVDAVPVDVPARPRFPDRRASSPALPSSSPKSSPPLVPLDEPLIGSAVKDPELAAALQARSSSPTPMIAGPAGVSNLWSDGTRTGSSDAALSSSPSGPSLVESQVNDPAFESLPATYFSQPFPRLLSSPPHGAPSRDRSYSSIAAVPPAETSGSTTPSTAPLRRSGWQDLQSGILQVPLVRKDTSESISALPASSSSGSTDLWHVDTNPEIDENGSFVFRPSRKRKRKEVRETQTQSQLAAFGFFPQQKKKKDTMRPGFERDWDDEADLQFDAEAEEGGTPVQRQILKREVDGTSGLGAVPEAPAHPSLRAAGIRELKKRRAASSSTPTPRPAATPLQNSAADLAELAHSSSDNDPTSTLTASSESGMPALGSETTRWWDQIEDRGLGEFRTPSEPSL